MPRSAVALIRKPKAPGRCSSMVANEPVVTMPRPTFPASRASVAGSLVLIRTGANLHAHGAAPGTVTRIWLHVKAHLLALAQVIEGRADDGRAVEEQLVLAIATIRSNKAKALVS